jgi:hypothetical protein
MIYTQCRNSYAVFVDLGIISIIVLGVYSDVSGRVRTVYPFGICTVSSLLVH